MTVNLLKLSLPHHRHRFKTGQSSPRGMETAEAEPRPDKALDAPVVFLDDVVQIFTLSQTSAARRTNPLRGRGAPGEGQVNSGRLGVG